MNIKKLELKKSLSPSKLNIDFKKTKVLVAYDITKGKGSLIAINIIKTIFEFIVSINDLSLGEYSFLSVPVENKGAAYVDLEITFKNILKLVRGIIWTRKKTV